MTDRTPDTEEIEHAYVDWRDFQSQINYIEWPGEDHVRADFRRWLAEHDREVKTRALRKAALDWDSPTDPGDRTPRTGSHAGAWLRDRAKAQEAQG